MPGQAANAALALLPTLRLEERSPPREQQTLERLANFHRDEPLENHRLTTNADGETQERVYDVACSGKRKVAKGKCKGAVGNTVDIATATYSNSIGAPGLEAYWQDPDFDPAVRAFY